MSATVSQYVSLHDKTTLKIGGAARYYVAVTTIDEVTAAVSFAEQKKLPLFVLGGGSNILVADNGVEAVVVKQAILGRDVEDVGDGTILLTLGGGETLDEVVAYTVREGWWGIENLSAIPGTVGATPVQNVGAYGVEASDVIESVLVYDTRTKQTMLLSNAACQFGYRDSLFKSEEGKHLIVLNVTYRLTKTPRPKISYADLANYFGDRVPTLYEIRDAVIKIRSKKFPDWRLVGTAGSFFKNPIIPTAEALRLKELYPHLPMYPATVGYTKVSLGFILDKVCGLKGFRDGVVGLYTEQALVLVTHGVATARDVEMFARHIQERVYEKTFITIEWEVQKIS